MKLETVRAAECAMMRLMQANSDPSIFVIFGGTGDLARRKLLPALASIHARGAMHEDTVIVGVGRDEVDDSAYRDVVSHALREFYEGEEDAALLSRIYYRSAPAAEGEFTEFLQNIDSLLGHDTVNHVFYLALPPKVFESTIQGLGRALRELADGGDVVPDVSCLAGGWNRIVVEKPFGTDLASARRLNDALHEHFSEGCIYRIDHYLGKDTVQNLLTYRFANAMLESSWNRERIDSVQITVGEHLGVGSRAGYYDSSGALRDMVQNHLMQLLTLVAMEPPTRFEAGPIRREKIKVLEAVEAVAPEDIVRGQYTAGTVQGDAVRGYLEEADVPADSTTETFVALKLSIDNWRWKGVPFYLRTGKRMPHKTSQIAIRYRDAPVRLFKEMGVERATSDVLLITLQPSEGFTFFLDIKVPGDTFELKRVPMRFAYSDLDLDLPDAYETLLADVLEGDQTLFVHGEETEHSWRICGPLLDGKDQPHEYPAGTWGPDAAKCFAIPETQVWQESRRSLLPPKSPRST